MFVSIIIINLTLKNECIFLKSEINHLNNVKSLHLNRVKILAGEINSLSSQGRIEQLAQQEFELYVPSPESLVVYVGDIK